MKNYLSGALVRYFRTTSYSLIIVYCSVCVNHFLRDFSRFFQLSLTFTHQNTLRVITDELWRFPDTFQDLLTSTVHSGISTLSDPALFQSPATFPVIRKFCLHDFPEILRMVHLPAVCQFVYHHIIQQLRCKQYQFPVKVQIALAATAPPACFLFPDSDPAIVHTHSQSKICCSFRKNPFRPLDSFPTLFFTDHKGWPIGKRKKEK